MKVFTAAMMHETNRFSPIPTDLESFKEYPYYLPGGKVTEQEIRNDPMYGIFVSLMESNGDEVVIGPAFGAQPSGLTAKKDYQVLRDTILKYLAKEKDEIDCVALFLHGAQMAYGYDDCEGDLLTHIRKLVGPDMPVAALLDLHGNLSNTMIEQSSFVIACKEYPHIDYPQRAKEMVKLLGDCVEGKIVPVSAKYRVPMTGAFYTNLEPLRSFVDKTIGLEKGDVLTISMMHGFTWSDTPDTRANIIVTTNNDLEHAETLAESLGKEFFEVGKKVAGGQPSNIKQVLQQAKEVTDGLVVIADTADNAGGGAPSDSTFILKELLDQNITNVALGMIWDPVTVKIASKAKIGSHMKLRIGGKVCPESGDPIDVDATIITIDKGKKSNPLLPEDPKVVIRVKGIDIIVNSIREQVIETSVFTDLGIELSKKNMVVVKSSQHFYDQFAPIAAKVLYCDTPGVLCKDLSKLDFQRLPRPIWPLDALSLNS
ncbi:MAG: microcystin LR degradation protein MlrC-like protein [Gammaproteobacteria bacterium]|nr:MAG: microcystin LR degradation protein MlrC-like protein [Gammaproteobacteria bacterium]